MKVTGKHLVYGAIVAVGLGFVFYDRASMPAAASAEETSTLAVLQSAPGAPGTPSTQPARLAENGDETQIAERLSALAAERSVRPESALDGFALPAAFRPAPASTKVSAAKPAAAEVSPAEVFAKKHKLMTVVVGGGAHGSNTGAALVDGRLLKVGDELDGFKLTAVTKKSATFSTPAGVEAQLSFAQDEKGTTASTGNLGD